MNIQPTGGAAYSPAEGGLMSSIEQFDGPIDCPNTHTPYMLGINDVTGRAIVFRPRCKMWSCPVCGRANAWLWSFRANAGAHQLYDAGKPLSFATITSSEKLTAGGSWWVAPKAWMKLQARIRRAAGAYDYFSVPEIQQNGRVHFHIIITVKLTKRWWKDNAKECGFGYMSDAKEVWSAGGVTGYVVKYLTKTLTGIEVPKLTRRVRTSRGWPKLPERDPPADWRFMMIPKQESIWQTYYWLYNRGYEVRMAGSKTAWQYVTQDEE